MIKNGNTLSWRVEQLEQCNKNTQEKLDKIMTNHLPHINSELVEVNGKMDAMNTRIALGIGINVVLLIAGVLGVVLLIR
jgi:wobble nucleotide-excising tRNase